MEAAGRDIVVVGASAGGVEALRDLVRKLPPGLPAAVFIVCHFPAEGRSWLPHILSREGALLAAHAHDGEPIYPGHIYVAPPDHHLLLEGKEVRLTRTRPRTSFARPSIRCFAPRPASVGRAWWACCCPERCRTAWPGSWLCTRRGGVAVLQDPRDALLGALPQNANEIVGADHVVSSGELAALLVRLIHQPCSRAPVDPDEGRRAEGSDALEAALWASVRTFKERSVFAHQQALFQRDAGNAQSAVHCEEEAVLALHHAELLQRNFLTGGTPAVEDSSRPAAEAVSHDSPPEGTEPT